MYSLLPNGPELGYTLTKALCEFASSRIGLTASDEELAASVITCVTDWTLVDQWLVSRTIFIYLLFSLSLPPGLAKEGKGKDTKHTPHKRKKRTSCGRRAFRNGPDDLHS